MSGPQRATVRSAPGLSPARLAALLRSGHLPSDDAFDRLLPDKIRAPSSRHWTPLVVVQRCAQWLDDLGIRTVVDLGSGAGKFCVATALASHCEFLGLEQRPWLVAAARELAGLFEVEDRVEFVQAVVGTCEVPVADAYYLFNPFGENLFGAAEHLDQETELSEGRYDSDVASVERLLERVPTGTFVLKYNGFGGRMPHGFVPVRVDRELPNVLRMWRKTRG